MRQLQRGGCRDDDVDALRGDLTERGLPGVEAPCQAQEVDRAVQELEFLVVGRPAVE